MIPLPSPLHPAIVHFPIVLLLLGTVAAVAAVFLRRWRLPLLAAILLTLGAAGAIAATWSGEEAAEMVGVLPPRVEELLDEHEEWGERTRNLAIAAGILAWIGMALPRIPAASRALGVLSAILALTAAFTVIQAGHYGGLLVYKHGLGVNTAAGGDAALPQTERAHAGGDHDD